MSRPYTEYSAKAYSHWQLHHSGSLDRFTVATDAQLYSRNQIAPVPECWAESVGSPADELECISLI